jgi:hypothetical protein
MIDPFARRGLDMHRPLRFFAASVSFACLAGLVGCGARVEPLDPYAVAPDDGGDSGVPTDTNGGSDTAYETGVYDSGEYDTSDYDTSYWDAPDYDSGFVDAPYYDSGFVDAPYYDSGFVDAPYYDSGFVDAFDTGIDAPPDVDGGLSNAICTGFETSACNGGTQACCAKAGLSYSTLGCDDAIKSWCGNQVNAVNGGTATYDGSQLALCQSRWQQFSNLCSVSLITYLKGYVPCSQLFNGMTAPGGTCSLDSDCYAPPNTVSGCDTGTGVCRAYGVVGFGQKCSFTGAHINYCDTGLYCDTTTYVCRTQKPNGAACVNAYDLSCGMGSICKSGRCAPGAPAGTSCTNDLQCASWSCQGNVCTDPNVAISSWGVCGG